MLGEQPSSRTVGRRADVERRELLREQLRRVVAVEHGRDVVDDENRHGR
jgi:hypothetical protein